jgi:hypothetical protein
MCFRKSKMLIISSLVAFICQSLHTSLHILAAQQQKNKFYDSNNLYLSFELSVRLNESVPHADELKEAAGQTEVWMAG